VVGSTRKSGFPAAGGNVFNFRGLLAKGTRQIQSLPVGTDGGSPKIAAGSLPLRNRFPAGIGGARAWFRVRRDRLNRQTSCRVLAIARGQPRNILPANADLFRLMSKPSPQTAINAASFGGVYRALRWLAIPSHGGNQAMHLARIIHDSTSFFISARCTRAMYLS
jgi:hypothetical protein